MAENGEAALNTSQPELLHMLWNPTVCCPSLMRKAMRCFFPILISHLFFSPCWPEETYILTFTSGLHLLPYRQGGKFAKWGFVGSTCLSFSVRRLHEFLGWQFSDEENSEGDCSTLSFSVISSFVERVKASGNFAAWSDLSKRLLMLFWLRRKRKRRRRRG